MEYTFFVTVGSLFFLGVCSKTLESAESIDLRPDDPVFVQLGKYGFQAMIGKDDKVRMPKYDGLIQDQEIVAALSYIKSRWPAKVRKIHDKINADYRQNKKMENKGNGL